MYSLFWPTMLVIRGMSRYDSPKKACNFRLQRGRHRHPLTTFYSIIFLFGITKKEEKK
jgi:hypothetical protein